LAYNGRWGRKPASIRSIRFSATRSVVDVYAFMGLARPVK
jgi:hypothetical protein